MRSLARATIGLIGAGNMGEALIRGLLAAGVSSKRLLVVEANPSALRRITRRYHVEASTLDRAATRADVVIVAVKPQDAFPVLVELSALFHARGLRRPLVVSIAAGLTIRALERHLGRTAVARVMPNLAAKVGCAVSAVAMGRWATPSHRALAKAIFRCVGEVVELPERSFDAVTAISGSGPAYFFLIFQALREAGVRAGLPRSVAEHLAVQTALGSARLVVSLREDVDRLVAQVASKKGTTEAALEVFRRRGLASILHDGVAAARRRSRELSRFLERR
jgi:pyrroline-5-carboxylate reductase